LIHFWHYFLLNETACSVQNGVVSFTVKKKGKSQNIAFLNGVMGLLLPLDARGRGRRCSCSSSPSLSQNQKKETDQKPPLA